ncbi:MAG: energy transducer TonB, partial [Bacteroidota bacterium]
MPFNSALKFFFLFFVFCNFVFAQKENEDIVKLPEPYGGKTSWSVFLENHLIYPDNLFQKKTESIVTAIVHISNEGELQKIDFKEDANEYFKIECIRLLRLLKWSPAKKNGSNISYSCELAFEFNVGKYKKAVKKRGFSKPKVDKKIPTDTSTYIHLNPDKQAEYFRGDAELLEFISENIEYPSLAKNQNIQGTVQLSFVVETDGMISNVKIEKSVAGGCNEAALDVMYQTRWKPAVNKGKYVRSRYQYAISFSLNDNFRA